MRSRPFFTDPSKQAASLRRTVSISTVIFMLALVLEAGGINASALTGSASSSKKFSDVPAASWYSPDLHFIASDARKILEGFADGRYYPDRVLSVEQFIKCAVTAAGFRPSADGGQWSQPYIDKALMLGMIREGQFDSFSRGITRGEMAAVIMSGMDAITGETPPDYDASEMQKLIPDYSRIDAGSTDGVFKAYGMGILAGYPDGLFHPERVLTRAQAVSVIRRMIDAEARIRPAPQGDGTGSDMWTDAGFEQFMATEEWKSYLNPHPFSGLNHGKVEMFFRKSFSVPDPASPQPGILPSALEEPYSSMFYQIVKHMAYYARKFNATATVGYNPESGGTVEFDFASGSPWDGSGFGSDSSFTLSFSAEPEIRPELVQMIPETKDAALKYHWHIRRLYKDEDIIGKEVGASPAGYDWSTGKYVLVLRSVCRDIYGNNQGDAFCDLMVDMYDKTGLSPDPVELDYSGMFPGLGTTVFLHYPDRLGQMHFYTGEVPERK
jgi:hypothetical protein